MKFIYLCDNCSHPNTLQFLASDRVELRRSYKSKLENNVCFNCLKKNDINVNSIKAVEDRRSNSIVFILGLIASIALGYFIAKQYWSNEIGISLDVIILVGGAIALPQILVAAIVQSNRKAVKIFNKHYV
jgi:hypothetical protein